MHISLGLGAKLSRLHSLPERWSDFKKHNVVNEVLGEGRWLESIDQAIAGSTVEARVPR